MQRVRVLILCYAQNDKARRSVFSVDVLTSESTVAGIYGLV